jgi:hypothetical protein
MDELIKPEGVFSTDVLNKDAAEEDSFGLTAGRSGGQFRLRVFQQNQFFDINHQGWGIISNGDGVRLEYYFWSGRTYLRVVSGRWSGHFLSASNNLYVGAYRWRNAIEWSIEESLDPWVYLATPWNNRLAGTHRDYGSYVLVWNQATPIKFERFR